MRLYPKNIEAKLGIDKIKDELHSCCLSPLGVKYVENLKPLAAPDPIRKLLKQTEEFQKLLISGNAFPQKNYFDIRSSMKKSEVPGVFLDSQELFEIKIVLVTLLEMIAALTANKLEYPGLFELSEKVDLNDQLPFTLNSKIDERGDLRDNASKELMEIRTNMTRAQSRARGAVNKVMKTASAQGYTPEGASITVREGRMVIPVLSEHKRHLKGFVHDESSTGQTVYMEPAEVLEINNELRELQYAEKREIIRILTDLTDQVRAERESIMSGQHFLGVIDFIRAKASFAQKYGCLIPQLEDEPMLEWYQARHPVLEQALNEQKRQIIPLNVKLDKGQHILLISGPNAGGKSVCLKTIGTLQYMVQCGLAVPVAEESKFGVFQNLFLDIGDEQSIENDLSTYSSHLTNMRFFLDHANSKTLFLIDEFGTGTEPQFGGAIAEVILRKLTQKQAFGAITTHYGNLKKAADGLRGVVNGAMRYDVNKLKPLYSLDIGKPGSSFALEIAGKIGLNQNLLDQAKKLAGVSHVQFDRMITQLENEKEEINRIKKEAIAKDKRLSQAIRDYEELKAFLEDEKPRIINEAKAEADRLIEKSNKQIEKTIREIKEAKADKQKTQLAREELQDMRKSVKPLPSKPESPKTSSIAVGDKVRLKNTDTTGEVLSIKDKKAEIVIGSIKSRVKLNDLEKISNNQYKKMTGDRVHKMTGIDVNAKMTSFSPNLDIRGVRAEEAIGKVESFLDEALLLGYGEIKVLHGKGHGVLREIVRNTLRENHWVGAIKDEHIDLGGSGITVVELK